MLRFNEDLQIIKKSLDLSDRQLAKELHINFPNINNWLNKKVDPDILSLENVYQYAYRNNLRINEAYADTYLESNDDYKVLFHGTNSVFNDIDLSKSKQYNDFSSGFYCGENYKQAAMFVAGKKISYVYIFGVKLDKLKAYTYEVDNDWMFEIAYNRGLLNNYLDSKKINKYINKSKNVDVVIAPIADNRMFEIIEEFVAGNITDIQCHNCLKAMDLGNQYVFKTQKAIDNIAIYKLCYLCDEEKKYFQNESIKYHLDKNKEVRQIRIKYKREGKYIEELL